MDWQGKQVAITGAAGFVGSHLTLRLLGLGARVRAMVHGDPRYRAGGLTGLDAEWGEALEIAGGDLRDASCVRAFVAGADTVFHLGAVTSVAYSYAHPEETIATNTVGTLNVCEACRLAGVRRLVHTSTAGAYGTARDDHPIAETHPVMACNPYTAGKLGGDFTSQTYHLSYGLPVVTVRLFNAFGPRMGRFLIMPEIIEQLLRGPDLKVGDLRPTRTFVYVDDIVEAYLAMGAAEGIEGELVHFGGQEEISMEALVRRIAGLMEVDVRIHADPTRMRPEKSEIFRVFPDCSKARNLLGWHPRTSLDEGLSATIAWLRHLS
jgi:dTDP-glucose 4,6-dehydratase